MSDLQAERAVVLEKFHKVVIASNFDADKINSFFAPDVEYEIRPPSAIAGVPGFPKDGKVPSNEIAKWYKSVHTTVSKENKVRSTFFVPAFVLWSS
jgi:hypothetical protein